MGRTRTPKRLGEWGFVGFFPDRDATEIHRRVLLNRARRQKVTIQTKQVPRPDGQIELWLYPEGALHE